MSILSKGLIMLVALCIGWLVIIVINLPTGAAPVGVSQKASNSDDLTRKYFDGHTYIVYGEYNWKGGMVHDPDCRCGWRNSVRVK